MEIRRRKTEKMKKAILYSLFSIFICSLFVVSTAQAAVVYLKNGRVMTGRIVARDQEKIELKTGMDDAAVRTTIFLDDINRIESEDEYQGEVGLIPFNLLSSRVNESTPGSFAFNNSETIKRLFNKKNESVKAENLSKGMEEEAPSNRQGPLSLTPDVVPPWVKNSVVSGSISGTVYLPPDEITREKGDLYVYLMKDLGQETLAGTVPSLYQKIPKEKIRASAVPYSILHVPKGKYKVFVLWDIAPVAVEEKKTARGIVLMRLERKGDYIGIYPQSLFVDTDQNRQRIDIKDLDFLTNDVLITPSEESPGIVIKDIVYVRKNPNEEKFELIVKNETDIETDILLCDVWVGGEEVSQFPLEIQPLEPNQEKRVDLTPYVKTFKEEFLYAYPDKKLPGRIKIRIDWVTKKEVLFEKTVNTLW